MLFLSHDCKPFHGYVKTKFMKDGLEFVIMYALSNINIGPLSKFYQILYIWQKAVFITEQMDINAQIIDFCIRIRRSLCTKGHLRYYEAGAQHIRELMPVNTVPVPCKHR